MPVNNSSTKPDANFVSVEGPQNLVCINAGSKDAYYPRNFNLSEQLLFAPFVANLETYASMLKFSKASNVHLTEIEVWQGAENSVDINNETRDVYLNGDFGVKETLFDCDQVITIKGGSSFIEIVGTLHCRGKRGNVDVDIGNWSDQSYGKCANIVLNLKHSDGGKVRVSLGRCDEKTVHLLGDCKKAVFRSYCVKAYWYAKYFIRKLLGIKLGEKGPSWF